jgi:hypothetical protein
MSSGRVIEPLCFVGGLKIWLTEPIFEKASVWSLPVPSVPPPCWQSVPLGF